MPATHATPTARDKILSGCAAGAAGAAVALLLWWSGALEPLERTAWRWRSLRLAAPGAHTDAVVLVTIDQDSLDRVWQERGRQWPWPGDLLARLVDACARAGARACVLDLPVADLRDAAQARDGGRLAAACERAGCCVVPIEAPEEEPVPTGQECAWLDAGQAAGIAGIAFPPEELAGAARVLCTRTFREDSDGVVRIAAVFIAAQGVLVPSAALGAVIAVRGPDAVQPHATGMRIGAQVIALGAGGRAVLKFRGPPGTYRRVSAFELLQDTPAGSPAIKPGDLVCIGLTDPALQPAVATPLGAFFPVELSATLADNLLAGDCMRRAAPWRVVIVCLFLCLAGGVLIACVTSPGGIFAASLLFVWLPWLGGVRSWHNGLWLPLAVLEAGVAVTVAVSVLAAFVRLQRKKRFLEGLFQGRVSRAVFTALVRRHERVDLGTQELLVSVMCAKILGGSDAKPPAGSAAEALQEQLRRDLCAAVLCEHGTLAPQQARDHVVAFWNAPLEQPDHAARAVRAARDCARQAWHLREHFRSAAGGELRVVVGVATGPALAGAGADGSAAYTLAGEAAAHPASFAGIAAVIGVAVLVCEETCRGLPPGATLREAGRFVLPGADQPVCLLEPVPAGRFARDRQGYEWFQSGLQAYYQGSFSEARRYFARAAERDALARTYLHAAEKLRGTAPAHWHGVLDLTAIPAQHRSYLQESDS